MLIISALLLLLLSIPDILFQRWQYRESLKMTREEVKEERKLYDGVDPQIRARIQRRMREFMSRNMALNVAKADVVITNPTHFAVALEYDVDTMEAPQLTAKGVDELAFKIREIARENGVPLVENKPLARALYAEVDVGRSVPVMYWEVIANILARIRRIDAERRRADGLGA
jgi:flagellar biosynthetic protein FlhB